MERDERNGNEPYAYKTGYLNEGNKRNTDEYFNSELKFSPIFPVTFSIQSVLNPIEGNHANYTSSNWRYFSENVTQNSIILPNFWDNFPRQICDTAVGSPSIGIGANNTSIQVCKYPIKYQAYPQTETYPKCKLEKYLHTI